MKVSRAYLNELVVIEWHDPRGGGERTEIEKALKGDAALAKWVEYGKIDDITDGVIRIRHSEAFSPSEKEADEAMFSWVPEVLIDRIVILEERQNGMEVG